ncbi:MAG TPA: hypothetical protein VJ810_33285 [Blastocatellia bacterium]|nr:hypothetical protein [Blastocatellia bacterium]
MDRDLIQDHEDHEDDNEEKGSDAERHERRAPKKDQIISLFTSGMGSVEDLAMITGVRPSYVASVLQAAGLMSGYFDLYTTTSHPMNVYSKFFAGKLGYKDEATARRSVALIERFYRQFETAGDRAGQHHALTMAMTMFNRARWTRKSREAEIFRQWLLARLAEAKLFEGSEERTGSGEWGMGSGGKEDD